MNIKERKINQPQSEKYYTSRRYLTEERWASYFEQIENVLKLEPKNCLLIGQGDNIVPMLLKVLGDEQLVVDTFDIVEDMKPTYVGNLLNLSEVVDKTYDVVICCQVLEHLPFTELETCLQEMKNVLTPNGRIVMSIPVFGRYCSIKIRSKWFSRSKIFPLLYKNDANVMCKEHYWKINSKGTELKVVLEKIKNIFIVENYYRVLDNPYHMFFILK